MKSSMGFCVHEDSLNVGWSQERVERKLQMQLTNTFSVHCSLLSRTNKYVFQIISVNTLHGC